MLDEPTIGLHQRDNTRLLRTLRRLQAIGNTVIIVEHDEDCIRGADHLIDIGPGAGLHGGNLMAAGPMPDVLRQTNSTTIKYLTGEYAIVPPPNRRPVDPDLACIELQGVHAEQPEGRQRPHPAGRAGVHHRRQRQREDRR